MPAPNKSLIISQQLEPILAHIHPNIPLHLWISSSVLHEQTNADSVYAQLMHHHTRLRSVYTAGQGAQAAHLEDSFDALWEAQHIDIGNMAEEDVLLSISCPYEDEDFTFLSSVMFLNAQVEDAADVYAGAGLYEFTGRTGLGLYRGLSVLWAANFSTATFAVCAEQRWMRR